MPFVKINPIQEAQELQELFKNDPLAKEEFRQYESAHQEAARLEHEELELRNRLVAFRKSKNITQKEIQSRSGMSQQAISRFESSKDTVPNLKTLIKYSEAIGCILVPKEKIE